MEDGPMLKKTKGDEEKMNVPWRRPVLSRSIEELSEEYARKREYEEERNLSKIIVSSFRRRSPNFRRQD
ncbi:uncharacterized protein G2W53_007495 [Senna tora]|uniref:Uncharacterized protein n=1 Tax=Senna tora TaxID=362788 RepID=A0A834X6D6_9FABA|nr:uncharacterized protein G2W53_007495 [Senna tora]